MWFHIFLSCSRYTLIAFWSDMETFMGHFFFRAITFLLILWWFGKYYFGNFLYYLQVTTQVFICRRSLKWLMLELEKYIWWSFFISKFKSFSLSTSPRKNSTGGCFPRIFLIFLKRQFSRAPANDYSTSDTYTNHYFLTCFSKLVLHELESLWVSD